MIIYCPKCDAPNDYNEARRTRISWHDGFGCKGTRKEHLHSYCVVCGYDGAEFIFPLGSKSWGKATPG